MKQEALQTGASPRVIGRLLGHARPYWALVLVALISLGLGTAAELGIPVLLQKTIDEHIIPRYQEVTKRDGTTSLVPMGQSIDQGQRGSAIWLRIHVSPPLTVKTQGQWQYILETDYQSLGPEDKKRLRSQDLNAIDSLALVFFLLLASSLIFNFLQIFTTALVGQKVMQDLRQGLLKKTMHQSLAFLQVNPVGKLVTRVTSDVETVNELFTSVLTAFVKDVAVMAGVLVVLFSLNAQLASIALIAMVPVLLLLLGFRSWYRRAYRTSRTMISRMNTFLSEHFSGMAIIQIFVRQVKVLKRFQKENIDLKKASLGEMYVFAVFRPLVDLMASLGLALVIWAGAGQILGGFLSLGVLVAFINLMQRFFEPVLDISDKFNILQNAMAGGERVFALLDEDQHLPDTGTHDPRDVKGAIVFDAVDFSYKPGEPILNGLSFTAEPGEKVAIVGYTGAGKTTLVTVLTRLWDIQGGSISLDGIDIRNYPLKTLRGIIQPIQQDAFFFTDTIRANLNLGKEIPDSVLWEALDRVQARDFVEKLDLGLDATINEGAVNLSAGQKQLLNFARILVQNPPVIIMDEASANIDTETEQKIQHAMKEVMTGRTSLVIAHRLSTIQDADRILVLNKGSVAESGTHGDLLNLNGMYASLHRLQFGNGSD